MEVWKAFEEALSSLDAKINRIEKARDGIPFEGTKAINVANILTHFANTLEEIHNLLNCLKELKDSSLAKGKKVVRIEGTHWTIQTEDGALVVKRVDPSLVIKISPEEVFVSSKHKDESGYEATFGNAEFKVRKDKVQVSKRYTDYEGINQDSYYIRYAFKDLAKMVMKRAPQLIQELKIKGVHCPT